MVLSQKLKCIQAIEPQPSGSLVTVEFRWVTNPASKFFLTIRGTQTLERLRDRKPCDFFKGFEFFCVFGLFLSSQHLPRRFQDRLDDYIAHVLASDSLSTGQNNL